jgi:non-ribosomal peptide synthetase component F
MSKVLAARFLVSRGAGPEGLVAVAMPRAVEMVVAVLAPLACGGAVEIVPNVFALADEFEDPEHERTSLHK